MTLFTIGFTKTTAEQFFGRLRRAEVKTVLDTRLNRSGQLSGFAKVPLEGACLLCSEHAPERCHRRLAAEYLRDAFATAHTIEIVHV